jgi:hypothetical protein
MGGHDWRLLNQQLLPGWLCGDYVTTSAKCQVQVYESLHKWRYRYPQPTSGALPRRRHGLQSDTCAVRFCHKIPEPLAAAGLTPGPETCRWHAACIVTMQPANRADWLQGRSSTSTAIACSAVGPPLVTAAAIGRQLPSDGSTWVTTLKQALLAGSSQAP